MSHKSKPMREHNGDEAHSPLTKALAFSLLWMIGTVTLLNLTLNAKDDAHDKDTKIIEISTVTKVI